MTSEKTSAVWNFFIETGDRESPTTTCNLCGTVLSHKGGSTKSMWNHLKSKHPNASFLDSENATKTTIQEKFGARIRERQVSMATMENEDRFGVIVDDFPIRDKQQPPGPPKLSLMWKFFEKTGDLENPTTTCNLCSTVLSHKGGSTKSMWNHMKFRHSNVNVEDPMASPLKFESREVEGQGWKAEKTEDPQHSGSEVRSVPTGQLKKPCYFY